MPRACQGPARASPSRTEGEQDPVGAGLQPCAPRQEWCWGPCLDLAPGGSARPNSQTTLQALRVPSRGRAILQTWGEAVGRHAAPGASACPTCAAIALYSEPRRVQCLPLKHLPLSCTSRSCPLLVDVPSPLGAFVRLPPRNGSSDDHNTSLHTSGILECGSAHTGHHWRCGVPPAPAVT